MLDILSSSTTSWSQLRALYNYAPIYRYSTPLVLSLCPNLDCEIRFSNSSQTDTSLKGVPKVLQPRNSYKYIVINRMSVLRGNILYNNRSANHTGVHIFRCTVKNASTLTVTNCAKMSSKQVLFF